MMPHGQGALNDGGSPGSYDGGAAEVGTDRVMLKKGPWTAAEDAILTEYVRTNGEGNWNAVQRNTGLARCGKSCRLRWANHLRPNLKKGAFTPEEERIIVELHAKLGNKWARMATQLPGRTDNEIKNYWNTRVKRRQRQGLPLYPSGIEPSYQSQQQPSYQLQQQPQATTTPLSSYNPMTTQSSSSSFTFQTQLLGQSPSPAATPTTPTPPSPLSSTPSPLSPSLSSPHQFPTLPLFEAPNSMTNTTTTANNRSSLSFLRPPPLLQTPPRFKRFHQDATVNHHDNTNVNNDGQGAAMQFTSTNTSTSGGFVIPMSNSFTSLLTRPNSCPTTPTPSSHTNAAARFPLMASSSVPSFSVNALPFNSGSPNILRGNFDSSGQQHMVSAPSPIYSMRSELPSSQLLSQNSHPEMAFVTDDNHERNNLGMRRCSSGLLDDMLAEAQAFAGGCSGGNSSESLKRYHEEKHALGGYDHWGPSSNANLCSEYRPKEEGATQMNAMHEDLTKLLHVIPSTRLPEWFSDSGDFSNGQSSVVTDDNLGLEMQQIASLFPVDPGTDQGRNPGSCSWDNLPGIC